MRNVTTLDEGRRTSLKLRLPCFLADADDDELKHRIILIIQEFKAMAVNTENVLETSDWIIVAGTKFKFLGDVPLMEPPPPPPPPPPPCGEGGGGGGAKECNGHVMQRSTRVRACCGQHYRGAAAARLCSSGGNLRLRALWGMHEGDY
jgi:hypothetical protein